MRVAETAFWDLAKRGWYLDTEAVFVDLLKVVGNEKLGGSRGWLLVEGDIELWRSMSVCFLCSRHLFFSVFPFPVCRAQLIGDWYENRRGAQNTIIYLTIRQYYWRTDAPCANIMADRTRKKKSAKHNLNIIGAQCLVNIAYWRRGTSVRQYPHRLTVRCASPIFIPIAY